jgi:hypothetical protein
MYLLSHPKSDGALKLQFDQNLIVIYHISNGDFKATLLLGGFGEDMRIKITIVFLITLLI